MTQRSRLALAAGALALAAACAAYQHQHAPTPAAGEETTGDRRVAAVRSEVEALKHALHEQGRYACCVEPACNPCLLERGECHCRDEVAREGPCCGECTEAWLEGRGTVEGVDPWELLERKKRAQSAPPPHRH